MILKFFSDFGMYYQQTEDDCKILVDSPKNNVCFLLLFIYQCRCILIKKIFTNL